MSADDATSNSTLFLLSDAELQQLGQILVPLLSISIITSSITSISFILIWIYYPPLADRVSFRLGFATMISDLFYTIFQLVPVLVVNEPGFMCSFMVWGMVCFSLMSVFFTACIAINLQTIFIHEYKGRHNFEKYYFIFSIGLALLISLLPLTQNMFGFDVPEEICWYKDSGEKYNFIWQWTTLFGWIELCVLYCAIVVIAVAVKLYYTTSQFKKTQDTLPISDVSNDEFKRLKTKASVSLVVKRVIWYPVVPIITQTLNWSVETGIYLQRRASYSFFLMTFVAMSIQGLLNALVFSQDIAFKRVFQLKKLSWWYDYVNTYELKYPHLSKNKQIESSKKSFTGSGHETNRTTSSGDPNAAASIFQESLSEVRNLEGSENVFKPTFLERLRYVILTKLFSIPEETDTLASLQHLISSTDKMESESATKSATEKRRKFLSLPGSTNNHTKNPKFLSLQPTPSEPSSDPEPSLNLDLPDSPTASTSQNPDDLIVDLPSESSLHTRHLTIGTTTPNYAIIGDENPLPTSKLLKSHSLQRNKKKLLNITFSSITKTNSSSNRSSVPPIANSDIDDRTRINDKVESLMINESNELPPHIPRFDIRTFMEQNSIVKKL